MVSQALSDVIEEMFITGDLKSLGNCSRSALFLLDPTNEGNWKLDKGNDLRMDIVAFQNGMVSYGVTKYISEADFPFTYHFSREEEAFFSCSCLLSVSLLLSPYT